MNFFLSSILIAGVSFPPSAARDNPIRPAGDFSNFQTAKTEGSGLSNILERCAAYCDKLSGAVLNFICRERIDEMVVVQTGATPYNGWDVSSAPILSDRKTYNKLVYDYQLIRDREARLTETRTLLKENGKTVSVPNAPLKTTIFWHKGIVLGPIGLLGRTQQTDFDYELVQEMKYKKDPVYLIKAVPKAGNSTNRLFGTIWVRKSDAGILKIEWEQASLGNYEKVLELSRALGAKPQITFVSEYAFEKNGIRFPSRYSIREAYQPNLRPPKTRSETIVLYDNYKFFTVETGVNIKES